MAVAYGSEERGGVARGRVRRSCGRRRSGMDGAYTGRPAGVWEYDQRRKPLGPHGGSGPYTP
eukprot:4337825-Prymnesium_polylepis.1